jgi:hypothetical protein
MIDQGATGASAPLPLHNVDVAVLAGEPHLAAAGDLAVHASFPMAPLSVNSGSE